MMLQYATYSVISPEGCASILWKSATKAAEAAETLGITADRLKSLGLIDEIIPEPLGGAHREHEQAMENVRDAIKASLKSLQAKPIDKLLDTRYDRLMSYGKFKVIASK
jgi:acetyl-CoA carboxylase carboxyl transferase subunit alpha